MSEFSNDNLRYPVGKQPAFTPTSAEQRADAIRVLSEFPEQLREALRGLDDAQLDTPYRPDGWTVRQLVHHVADSHTTAVFRMRKALVEDWPEVPGYPEALFANFADYTAPVEWSVNILEGTHARWVMLLHSVTGDQWQRGVTIPSMAGCRWNACS